MSSEEKLDHLIKKLDDHTRAQREWNGQCDARLEKMARGIYGDKENGQKGLIELQAEDQKKFVDVEKKINTVSGDLLKVDKRSWKVLTAIGALIFAWEIISKFLL